MFDENIFAPRKNLPGSPRESASKPVLLLQANFIVGGLLCYIRWPASDNGYDRSSTDYPSHL